MFSFRKPVHSASFFSHCLCRLLFIVATLFIAAVRVLSDSTMFLIWSGMCLHVMHGQTPTGVSFFNPTQSVWNHCAHTLHCIISCCRPLRFVLYLHVSVHTLFAVVVGDVSWTVVSRSTGAPATGGSSSTGVLSAIVSVNLCNQAYRDFGVVLVQASLPDER